MSIFEQSASDHLQKLVSGEATSVELTRAYLDRIEAVDSKIGAFLQVDGDRALERAAEIDKRRADKQAIGRLAGLPVAVKDILCERGHTVTCGSRMLERFRP